jgi:GNAT superfamily N-acetyltransferase
VCCGELYAIYLLPDAWRRGGGTALCMGALEALRHRGLNTVTLWVLRQNGPARAFYERMGFLADGASNLKPHGDPVEVDEVRYRRAL